MLRHRFRVGRWRANWVEGRGTRSRPSDQHENLKGDLRAYFSPFPQRICRGGTGLSTKAGGCPSAVCYFDHLDVYLDSTNAEYAH